MAAEAEGRDLVLQTSGGDERSFEDAVVGDLWYCAGQSNMELGMAAIADRSRELEDLPYPDLRLFLEPKAASGQPETEVFGGWLTSTRANPTTGGCNGFSAVA